MRGKPEMNTEKIFRSISPPWLHLAVCDEQQFANWSARWTDVKKGEVVATVARTIRGKKMRLFEDLCAVPQKKSVPWGKIRTLTFLSNPRRPYEKHT